MLVRARGFGFVDVVVGIGLMLLLFVALFGVLRASLLVSTLAKAKAAAVAVAESQMEYLRGLSYDSLGIVGGIPGGPVAGNVTSTVDGVAYATRTFIEYYDDPADGVGTNDTNGVTTDYKVAKVTVTYSVGGHAKSVALVSDFAPPGIETSTGGGTLQIKVVNAGGAPVPGASVQVVNADTSPTINLTTFSNASGIVLLGGAATSASYQINVSENGYSSAQTYARTAQNTNPTPGYLTVSKDQTTTSTFAIDLLASLTLASFSPATTTNFFDTFAGTTNLATTTGTASVAGSALTLSSGNSSGSALSVPFTPSYLSAWGSASAALSSPASTTVAIQVYDGARNLLPDAALAGNAAGFTSFPVNLSGLSTTTYPALALGAALASATSSVPSVLDWTLAATTGPTPLPNVSYTLTGAKTVGSTSGGTPIYKTMVNGTTGSSAKQGLSLEWDAYTLALSGYDVVDACAAPPYALSPSANASKSLYLGSATSDELLVSVADNAGAPVSGASVQASRTGFSSTNTSSACGNAYFGALAADTYTVTISKAGYTSTQLTNVAVAGQTYLAAAFP